jgi:hypothetical protein
MNCQRLLRLNLTPVKAITRFDSDGECNGDFTSTMERLGRGTITEDSLDVRAKILSGKAICHSLSGRLT